MKKSSCETSSCETHMINLTWNSWVHLFTLIHMNFTWNFYTDFTWRYFAYVNQMIREQTTNPNDYITLYDWLLLTSNNAVVTASHQTFCFRFGGGGLGHVNFTWICSVILRREDLFTHISECFCISTDSLPFPNYPENLSL